MDLSQYQVRPSKVSQVKAAGLILKEPFISFFMNFPFFLTFICFLFHSFLFYLFLLFILFVSFSTCSFFDGFSFSFCHHCQRINALSPEVLAVWQTRGSQMLMKFKSSSKFFVNLTSNILCSLDANQALVNERNAILFKYLFVLVLGH